MTPKKPMVTVIRFELGDEVRRAIRKRTGESGLATRRDIEAFVQGHMTAIIEELMFEHAEPKP